MLAHTRLCNYKHKCELRLKSFDLASAQLSTVQAAAAAAAEYEARQRIAARKKQTRMHMWEKTAYRRQAKAFGNFYDGIHAS